MGFIRNTLNAFNREVGRIMRYPAYPVLMFILPVVSFLFFGTIFSIGVPRDIPVAVLDNDKSPLSRKLLTMMDATPAAMLAYEVTDMAEGEDMIGKGIVMGVVEIPKGFEKDVYSFRPTTVSAYVSGLNVTANGMLTKDLQLATTTFMTGIQIQQLMSQGLTEDQALAQAMPFNLDSHVLFNPYINYGYYLLPSFLPLMLMIFTLILTIFSIGTELKNATTEQWLATTGGRILPALTGKLLPYTLAMFLMTLFMNTIMYKWIEVPLNGSVLVLIIAGFMFILAYQSIGVLIISVLSNLRQALSIGGGYSVLAFTFSGLTFPLMAMDTWLQVISYIFPFTLYTEVFVDQAIRGAPVIYSVQHLGWLSLYIILPLLCLPRLRQVATEERFWRKL